MTISRIPRKERKTQIVNWGDAIGMVINDSPGDNTQ
jgi:hypothetical protein